MSYIDVTQGDAPVIIAMPHTGTELLPDMGLRDEWLARKDTDWWIDRLYDFAPELGVTTIRTRLSRSVIDVNRDPSGASLYPGMITTDLCPVTTFDNEPLYLNGHEPDADEIKRRQILAFDPYHSVLEAEIARLKTLHKTIIVYDAHSIRSYAPRLFDGQLPQYNIGSFNDQSCSSHLSQTIMDICASTGQSYVLNGRFKGGWTTRHYGNPAHGIHAVQMELSCRGYMDEPDTGFTRDNWPSNYEPMRAQSIRATLIEIITSCIQFAQKE